MPLNLHSPFHLPKSSHSRSGSRSHAHAHAQADPPPFLSADDKVDHPPSSSSGNAGAVADDDGGDKTPSLHGSIGAPTTHTRSSVSSQPSSILLPSPTTFNSNSGPWHSLNRLSLSSPTSISTSSASTHTRSSRTGTGADTPTTPSSSTSSLSPPCPCPNSSGAGSARFPFLVVSLSASSTLQFIALPQALRPGVLDALTRAWPRGVSKAGAVEYAPELMRKHREKGVEGSAVWEVHLKGECWVPRSEEKVASKRVLIYLMKELAKEGFQLESSFRTSAKDSGKDTLIFHRLPSLFPSSSLPDPIFFCVAFHGADRIWIIDAEADVGQALEAGITTWYTDGVRDVRTRERHCREIRLKGSPWTSHNASSLISARCIHLVIRNIITSLAGHCAGEDDAPTMGAAYEFVGSVDMADKEEGEMAATFYRKR